MQEPHETNWIALYISIVHYKETSIETALDVAEGLYKLKPETKVITVEMVRKIIKTIDHPKFSNLGRLESEIKINCDTIMQLYISCKSMKQAKLTDMDILSIIRVARGDGEPLPLDMDSIACKRAAQILKKQKQISRKNLMKSKKNFEKRLKGS